MMLVLAAHKFAAQAHRGQRRRYTGEPYIVHPAFVASLVRSSAPHDEAMIAAAWLHDVVEDTPVTNADIKERFDVDVAALVGWLTKISRPGDGNRAARKAMDRARLSDAPGRAQTIKVADVIHNTRSIVAHDPDFAEVYLAETAELL